MIKTMSRGVGSRTRGKPSSSPRRNVGGGNSGNQYYESNGPGSVKIKGNTSQILERYTSLAKDAQQSGADRVQVESLMQHAEHYARVLKQKKERSSAVPVRSNGGQESRTQEPRGQESRTQEPRTQEPRTQELPITRRRNRFDSDGPRIRASEPKTKPKNATVADSEDDDKQGLLDVLGIEREA